MIDPFSVLLTLAVLGVGVLIGRYQRRQPVANDDAPRPWCMCQHHYGTHDPKTGACQTKTREPFRDTPGGAQRDVWVDCPCVRYTGPTPVERYWVAPAADMQIITAPRPVDEPELPAGKPA